MNFNFKDQTQTGTTILGTPDTTESAPIRPTGLCQGHPQGTSTSGLLKSEGRTEAVENLWKESRFHSEHRQQSSPTQERNRKTETDHS